MTNRISEFGKVQSMRRLAVMCVVIGLPSVVAAQAPMSIEKCLEAVVHYETAFHGKTVIIRVSTGLALENEEAHISISDDGRFSRVYHTFSIGERLQRVEACVAGGQLIEAIEVKHNSVSEPYKSITGMLDFEFHAASVRRLGSYLCGVSQKDGKRFSTILTEKETRLRSELAELEGHEGPFQKLIGHHPKYGEYSFWIALGDRPMVKQIRIHKRTGDFLLESIHSGPTTIGAAPFVGPEPDKKLQAKLEAEAAKMPRETEREIVVGPIEYEFLGDGTVYPIALIVKSASRYRDQSEFAFESGEHVVAVNAFRCSNPENAHFEKLKLKDGMPVQVAGQIGAAYELRGGRIVRVIDVDSVARMDGIRYRKPASHWQRYVILALIGAVALIILLRFRLREQ